MSDAYGSLNIHDEPGIALAIPVAGTFEKWINFNAGLAGPTDLVIVDAANNQFEIGAKGAGVYRCTVAFSGFGSANVLIHGAVFLNNVRQVLLEFDRQMGAGPDRGAAPINDFIALAVGDILDFRFTTDGNNKTVTVIHLNFTLHALVRAL